MSSSSSGGPEAAEELNTATAEGRAETAEQG